MPVLRVLGSSRQLCDGVSRRDFLQVGSLGFLGITSAGVAALEAAQQRDPADALKSSFGRAKSVILLFLFGGASQLETFDVKPDAPLEVRGTLKSIPTAVPGYRVCEGLPRIAGLIDRTTVLRSLTHPYPIHPTSYVVTSTPFVDGAMQDNPRDPRHWPFIGSVVDYLDERRAPDRLPVLPRNLALPFRYSSRSPSPIKYAGPYCGFLGSSYDPVWAEFEGEALHEETYHFGGVLTTVRDPYGGIKPNCSFQLPSQTLPAEITLDRLDRRRSLLGQFDEARRDLDRNDRVQAFGRSRDMGYSMLRSGALRRALDVGAEPRGVRERYGMTLFGQATMVARRVIEAGGRFVTVFWDDFGSVNAAWDTHFRHYPRLTNQLLPGFDLAYSALLTDLEQRGLLDETLVICTTEHGRTPKLDPDGDHHTGAKGLGGRNHWSRAYSSILAGAGIRRGHILGKTDKVAGEVVDSPISPHDILATTYHLLGIDPHTLILDRTGRPFAIGGNGRVLAEALV